jgi:hypothetical protein
LLKTFPYLLSDDCWAESDRDYQVRRSSLPTVAEHYLLTTPIIFSININARKKICGEELLESTKIHRGTHNNHYILEILKNVCTSGLLHIYDE